MEHFKIRVIIEDDGSGRVKWDILNFTCLHYWAIPCAKAKAIVAQNRADQNYDCEPCKKCGELSKLIKTYQ